MHKPAFLCATASLLAPAAAQFLHDFEPTTPEVILNTDRTTVVPKSGVPYVVTGGVFFFRDVHIPQGVTVHGEGSRPMVWVVSGNFVVDGLLSVRGLDGVRVDTLNSANFPAAGGLGGPNAGDGGAGSPGTQARSMMGEDGYGPVQLPNAGGGGGRISCLAGAARGSGGGGGSFATMGDPWYPSPALAGTAFQQRAGIGGQGGSGVAGAATRTLPGGAAGASPFTDARDDNDFWGVGFDFASRRLVVGELWFPVGGRGGGGGGDESHAGGCNPLDPNWINDAKGGGGGGGGGCLIIYARGLLQVGASGRINADGGHGGGGEQAGSSNQGGGGGGGSGGMVVLASSTAIALDVKGETFANRDYQFVLSADGGICKTGSFGAPVVTSKYPVNGQPTLGGAQYDGAPLGGFGGMGVVQLMAPPGLFNLDGTNTIFDDRIFLRRGGQLLRGADKQRFLGWRGWRNGQGVLVDDRGNPTNASGGGDGDIRPAPVLLPLFF